MPRGQRSKLRAREKRRQRRAESQDLKTAQAAAGEEEEAASCSSSLLEAAASSSTGAGTLQAPPRAPTTSSAAAAVSCERSATKATGHGQKGKTSSRASSFTESSCRSLLSKKATMLVEYMLYQHKNKEPIKKTVMLKIVHKWYEKDFAEILRRAAERIDLFFGLQLKEVKPSGDCYELVDNPDDPSDLSSGWRYPKKGILMPLLSVIFLNGNCASEEEIWKFLNTLGIYSGRSHLIFGDPGKLVTQDLVQEEYLVYRQVPSSHPPRYEFLWGPRAHAETSKRKVLEFLAKLDDTDPANFTLHYEEALREEEERAQAMAQAAPKAHTPSGPTRAPSSHDPHPQ